MKNIILKLQDKKAAIIRGAIIVLSALAMAKGISYLLGFPVIELIYPISAVGIYLLLVNFLIGQLKKSENFFKLIIILMGSLIMLI